MSYDIYLVDPITKEPMRTALPFYARGGTYQVGGTHQAHLNITYNYSGHYANAFGIADGVRSIYDLTGAQSAQKLLAAILKLGDDVDNDYWKPTEGNAKQALVHLLMLAMAFPTGVWTGD